MAIGISEGYSRLYDIADHARQFKSVKLPVVDDINSVEYVFQKAKFENFLFQINGKKYSPLLQNFLESRKSIISFGGLISNIPAQNYQLVVLAKAYDGFVFFRHTTAATDIK
ncbi:MAG: hypothetical protein EOO43_22865 [Flavobacterium sp.]|nr:MAG: hypothetical protein EOO43_22865 [Flavobacterium sp.]